MTTDTATTMSDVVKSAPEWAGNMFCPECDYRMTMIKRKPDPHWGENITYQCHKQRGKKTCNNVVNLTTKVIGYMEPENFELYDIGWRNKAAELKDNKPPANKVDFKFVKPTNPYLKRTAKSMVWAVLWDMFDAGSGKKPIEIDTIFNKVIATYPEARQDKVREALKNTKWLEYQSGYIVEEVTRGSLGVSGIGKGNPNLAPYSQPEYRKQRGME